MVNKLLCYRIVISVGSALSRVYREGPLMGDIYYV